MSQYNILLYCDIFPATRLLYLRVYGLSTNDPKLKLTWIELSKAVILIFWFVCTLLILRRQFPCACVGLGIGGFHYTIGAPMRRIKQFHQWSFVFHHFFHIFCCYISATISLVYWQKISLVTHWCTCEEYPTLAVSMFVVLPCAGSLFPSVLSKSNRRCTQQNALRS